MAFVGICYPQGNVFDPLPLHNSSDDIVEGSLVTRDGWNFPKYVSKLNNIKQYQDIEEIPLKNRFSCLSNILQLEMERCISPPLTNFIQNKSMSKPIKTKRSIHESKLTRHKSLQELNIKPGKAKNEAEIRNAKLFRHKSLSDLSNSKHIKNKNSQTIKRNISLSDIYFKSKDQIAHPHDKSNYVTEHSKSMENVNEDVNLSNLKSQKSAKKTRRNRKNRKESTNLNMVKSMSTSDLSNLKENTLFPDQAYTDFSAVLKSVKQTLQEIMDKGSKENLTDQTEGTKQSLKPLVPCPYSDKSLNGTWNVIPPPTYEMKASSNDNSSKMNSKEERRSGTEVSPLKVEQKEEIKPNKEVFSMKKENNVEPTIPSAHITGSAPIMTMSPNNKMETVPFKSDAVNTNQFHCTATHHVLLTKEVKISKETQTDIEDMFPTQTKEIIEITSLASIGTQTYAAQCISMETQTVVEETLFVSTETQTVINSTQLVSVATQTVSEDTVSVDTSPFLVSTETQTENILTLIVSPKTCSNTIRYNNQRKTVIKGVVIEEDITNDITEEENDDFSIIDEDESDTSEQTVTPSKWLASMGMHKLCIFSQKDVARIKSYDYFLPQLRDFDPNLVVVHIGMSDFTMAIEGMEEEVPGVGEAIMKVVEICSDYGVRNVAICNVKNRSTSFIGDRRIKLRECLIGLCRRERVRFRYKNKIYFQRIYPDSVKLSVPDQWLCSECRSDQPWKSEDRKRVREEVLKCYDQISLLESNYKDAEKEIKALRNFIQNATDEKEFAEKAHKKEIMELRCMVNEKSRDLDMLRTNLRFR